MGLLKSNIVRKFLSSYIIALLVLSSFSMLLIQTASASSTDNEIFISPTMQNVTIGETFYTDFNINVNWEINNVTITNITFNPGGIINLSKTQLGTLFTMGGTILGQIPKDGVVNNASGYSYPLIWINESGVNTTTATIANITWLANGCGYSTIHLTGTTRNNSGTNATTVLYDGTAIVHPKGPSNILIETHNSTQINLTFTSDQGADNIIIVRKIGSPPLNISDGTMVYNGTSTSCIDTGLIANTTYYYKGFGWNNTYDLYSIGNENIYNSNTTQAEGGGIPSKNTILRGYVKDISSFGLNNVQVNAYNQSYGNINATSTNISGYYQFNITEGIYSIAYSKINFTTAYYNTSFTGNSNNWYNVTLNETGGGNQSQQGNSTIQGYIISSGGNSTGISGANVDIDKDGGGYSDTTATDSSGFFIFTNLTSGQYTITAYKPGVFENEIRSVTAYDNQTSIINISISVQSVSELILGGIVVQDYTDDYPVSGATITALTDRPPYDDIVGQTTTDSQGLFHMTVTPNMSAAYQYDAWDIKIIISRGGYVTNEQETFGLYDQRWNEQQHFMLTKIWNITAYAQGYIHDNQSQPIANASVFTMVDGNYFFNQTMTNSEGYYLLGLYSDATYNEFEIIAQKQNYFVNMSEGLIINSTETCWQNFTLETRPGDSAYITGYINCSDNDEPLSYIELTIYDPDHPFESQEADFPRTNATGHFNISTYPGTFYLITLADMIGERKDGPPLAIGGYDNEIASVTVAENETIVRNITLNQSSPDVFKAEITFSQWNTTTVSMSRIINGNAKILRYFMDEDLSLTVSADEASALLDTVNSSVLSGSGYSKEAFFIYMKTGDTEGILNMLTDPILSKNCHTCDQCQ